MVSAALLVAVAVGAHAIAVQGLLAPPNQCTAGRRRLVRRELSPGEAWQSYSVALETAPLVTKCATATVIIAAGDAVAQAIEDRGGVDFGRVARWGLFGLVLQAPWNHYYQNAIEAAIPSSASPWTTTTALKVALDQFVQAPIFTILVFYFFALVEGRGLQAAGRQVADTLPETLLKNWLIFIPATFVNFAFVPLEFRVLWINCVFFCWVIVLSLLLNRTKGDSSLS